MGHTGLLVYRVHCGQTVIRAPHLVCVDVLLGVDVRAVAPEHLERLRGHLHQHVDKGLTPCSHLFVLTWRGFIAAINAVASWQ
jgi:hypothetical protein